MKRQDQIIKNQAIQREYAQAERREREPKFPQQVGNVSIGSIYDCNRKSFERALKNYWDKLYVGWNPLKRDGLGCWEVWQRPSQKSKILRYEDKATDTKIYTLEYIPNDFEHWVADLEYLSYDFIGKLRAMDSWENRNLISDHDAAYEAHQDKLERDASDNIKQIIKENKQTFRDLLDYVQSGYNPLDFFNRK